MPQPSLWGGSQKDARAIVQLRKKTEGQKGEKKRSKSKTKKKNKTRVRNIVGSHVGIREGISFLCYIINRAGDSVGIVDPHLAFCRRLLPVWVEVSGVSVCGGWRAWPELYSLR